MYMMQVILIPDEDGGYAVEVPSLPGCISQGDTMDEALDNIREAIQTWIEDAQVHGEEIPEDLLSPNSNRLVNTKPPVLFAQECIAALQRAGFQISYQHGNQISLRRDVPFAKVIVPNHKSLKKTTLKSILWQAK
jgi:predicted RNase H-like HicB family nuclease/predicted RNA binding protein YcfA (HicA-like mRNA interferase family)